MPTDKKLSSALRELSSLATPTPWEVPEGHGGTAFVGGQRCVVVQSERTREVVAYMPCNQRSDEANPQLLLAMCNSLPSLLEEIDLLRRRVFELEALIDGDGK